MLKNPSADTIKTALLYLEREEKDESFWELRRGCKNREKLARLRIAIRELRSILSETLLTAPALSKGQPHGAERDWR